MKKTFTVIAATIISVASTWAQDFSVESGSNTIYLYKSGDKVSVVDDLNGSKYSGDVEIPATVEYGGTYYNVTEIGNNAFANCKGLTAVCVPATITVIGDQAFAECSSLRTVNIPMSVTEIGMGAFQGCSSLEEIYMGHDSPIDINVGFNAFNGVDKSGCKLIVAVGHKADFMESAVWRDFNVIEETSAMEQCDTPIISIEDNRLTVSCATPGAIIHTSIVADDHQELDHKAGYGINLSGQYTITSVAKAGGYLQSEPATALLVWAKASDTPSDTDLIEKGFVRPLLVSTDATGISINGTVKKESIELYDINGALLSTCEAEEECTHIPFHLQKSHIYIICISERSIKLAY